MGIEANRQASIEISHGFRDCRGLDKGAQSEIADLEFFCVIDSGHDLPGHPFATVSAADSRI